MSRQKRIVIEGIHCDFENEVKEWLSNLRIRRHEMQSFGLRIVVTVFYAYQVRKLIENLSTLKNCYRAIFPSHRGIPQVITGPAFELKNKGLAKAAGRHIKLSALPSEIVAARSLIVKT